MKALRILFSIVVGLLGVMIFTTHAVLASKDVQAETTSSITWTRTLEPVIITGGQVTQFSGVDISHIFAYAYSAGAWEQIPLQIDEVNALGQYGVDNGVLDENDELVFMAMDLGEMASNKDWISNGASKNFNRYQLEVTNPLTPTEVGYVYLFQSNSVIRTHPDYIDWLTGTQEIVSEIYSMGIITSPLQRLDSLKLNGNDVDVLDRSKYRLRVRCKLIGEGIPYTLNEDFIEGLFEEFQDLVDFFEFAPRIDGTVRVGGGSLGWTNWSYPAMRQSQFGVDFDTLATQICEIRPFNFGRFEEFRFSLDWIDPYTSGMTMYYDSSHPVGVNIDGINDTLPVTPTVSWSQVSGSNGSMVRLTELGDNLNPVENWYQNYYKDDSSVDIFDTGDQKSFADFGFLIEFPQPPASRLPWYGTLEVDTYDYFLGPNSPNVGGTYLNYKENPFLVGATSQDFYTELYLPLILRGSVD